MTATSADDDRDGTEADHDPGPVTDELHENSWSANLEGPEHDGDRERVLEGAREAIEHTAPGYHVNLVTHGENGHPAEYLFDELDENGAVADYEYVRQCGCGGHVTRVQVE